MSRLDPVPREEWSGAMHDALAAMRPPVPRYHPVGRADRPQAGNTLDTFAHHPALTQAFLTFNGHILYATTLTERQREILVLRVAACRESAYLWAHASLPTSQSKDSVWMARRLGTSRCSVILPKEIRRGACALDE